MSIEIARYRAIEAEASAATAAWHALSTTWERARERRGQKESEINRLRAEAGAPHFDRAAKAHWEVIVERHERELAEIDAEIATHYAARMKAEAVMGSKVQLSNNCKAYLEEKRALPAEPLLPHERERQQEQEQRIHEQARAAAMRGGR